MKGSLKVKVISDGFVVGAADGVLQEYLMSPLYIVTKEDIRLYIFAYICRLLIFQTIQPSNHPTNQQTKNLFTYFSNSVA